MATQIQKETQLYELKLFELTLFLGCSVVQMVEWKHLIKFVKEIQNYNY